MTVESIKEIVENIQTIYTIILALALAEAFNQSIKKKEPEHEKHATSLRSWLECLHPTRFVSLIVFLLLAIPFFQGNQKYLYVQYIEPLYSAHPPTSINAVWLNFDCLTFALEAGLFFVMSRSLSACRWQQFYATIAVLMGVDFAWAAIERIHGARVPASWLWIDLGTIVVLVGFIVADRFFVRYERGKELNLSCYVAVSLVAILLFGWGYFYDVEYLIDY